jgi:uncharacterized protein DUF4136
MPRLLVPLLVMALAAGCTTGPRVHVTQHPDADFSGYQTFNFHPEAGVDEDAYETAVAAFIKRTVTAQMNARGYRLSADPDLLVNFRLGDRERIETRGGPAIGLGLGVGGGHNYGHSNWALGYATQGDVRSYTEGSLIIDLVDPDRNEQIWTATAIERVSNADLDHAGEAAQQAVLEIFERFPYAVGGGQYLPIDPP